METNKVLPVTFLGLLTLGYVSYALLNKQNSIVNEPIVNTNKSNLKSNLQQDNNTKQVETKTVVDNISSLKDGVYSQDIIYTAHGNKEIISVTTTIENDILKDIQLNYKWAEPSSQKYTSRIDEQVLKISVGKKIDDAMLSRVSGATEAGNAFNSALQKIAQQAQ